MSYIGIPPYGQTVRSLSSYTATAGQTTFYPTGGYTVTYLDVYLNGIRQVYNTDYTASDGLSVVFTDPLLLNDVVEIVVYQTISFADSVKRSGDTLQGTYYTRDVLPATNNYYSLGSSDMCYKDIYLSNGSIYVGDVVISSNATNLIVANTTGGALALSNTSFPNTGVTAGSYGNSSAIPVITVDSTGRVTSATTNAVAGVTGFTYTAANATFTISTGAGSTYLATIAANSITTGMLTDSGVTAGAYGNTTAIPVITVDAKGRVTAMSTSSVSGVTGTTWTAANNTLTVATSTTNYTANLNSWANPVTFSNTVAAGNTTVTGYANVSTTLQVTGAATLSNTIAVTGSATLSNTIAVTGNATFSNTLAVTGTSTFTGLITGTITSANNADYLDGQHGSYYSGLSATAYSNAVATAATDASTKAATAYTNAVAYAAANTYVNTTFAPKAGPTFTGTAAFADITVSGNLTTSGTVTYINSTNLNVGDNIITLNADVGAVAPTENAGIEINRGTSANVALRWYEASDEWQVTTDGTTYAKLATNNDITTAQSYADTKAAAAYTNATSYAATIAGTAYSNAITISANATNLTNGTVAPARLPQANTTANGAVLFLDSVSNTATSIYAPTMNAVKTAYDAAITANTNAATASSKADAAYTNAVAYAAANSYVNTQLGLKANLSGATFSGAVSGITTLAAGNTTITGFANVSSTLQVIGGSTLTGAVTMANTLAVTGTSTFTGLITGTITSANNADYLDGQHGSYYAANTLLANYLPLAGGTMAGAVSTTAGANAIVLSNATSNYITWNNNGVAAPTATTRSAGTKLVLYGGLTATSVDYALGIESSTLWQSVPDPTASFKWYANTTLVMTANTTGLNLNSRALSGVTTLAAGNTTITGFANVTGTGYFGGKLSVYASSNTSYETTSIQLTDGVHPLGSIRGYNNGSYFQDIRFYVTPDGTNESHVMTLQGQNQYVGIGNTAPTHKLSVNGTCYFGSSVAAGNTTITGFANVTGNGYFGGNLGVQGTPVYSGINFTVGYDTSGQNSIAQFGSSSDGIFITSNSPILSTGVYYNSGWIATATSGSYTNYSGGTFDYRTFTGATVGTAPTFASALTITPTGNTTVGGTLTVSGATTFSANVALTNGNLTVSSGFYTRLKYNSSDDYSATAGWAWYQMGNNGQNDLIAGKTTVGGYLNIVVNNTVDKINYANTHNGTVAATFAANGNVGIGNTAPAHKLSVNGNIYAGVPFIENATVITANYTVAANTNAMSAGPITIADGVTVTVSNNSVWTVV